MSILIRGMEMPKNCTECIMRLCGCEQRIYQECRPKGCPLIEVKTPHGRLIDADAEVSATYFDEMTDEWEKKTVKIIQVLADCVEDSVSTIIEAEV